MADAIRELVIKVTVEADEKPLEQVGKTSDEVGVKAVALGNIVADLAKGLGQMALQAVKAGAAFAKDLVFGTAEAADRMVKLADRTGQNVEQLQRLQGATELAGGEAKNLSDGVRDLQKNLGDSLAKGTGPATEALAQLSVDINEVDAALAEGEIEDALGLISDGVVKLGDDSKSNAALLKLFGGSGEQLGNLMRQGSEGIKAAGDQIEATGSIIEEDALRQFEAMNDASLLLDKQIEGVKNQVAIGLAPVVVDISDKLREWVAENEDFIQQDLPEIMAQVGDALIDVATFTIDLLKSWREFIRDTSDLVEILTADLGPALDGIGGSFATIGGIIDGVALGVADLTVQLLEAVGASEELIQVFREIRTAISGDDEPRSERGAGARFQKGAALQGGGAREEGSKNVGGQALSPKFVEAIQTRDTSKLAKIVNDPAYADSDRRRAANLILDIDREDSDAAAQEQAQRANESALRLEASKRRAKAAREAQERAAGGGGPGGRGRRGGRRSGPTVEDLIGIGTAPGGAEPAALRSAVDALSGTFINQTDQRVIITVDPGAVDIDVEVSAALPADVAPEIRNVVREEATGVLTDQVRELLDLAVARRNVGP